MNDFEKVFGKREGLNAFGAQLPANWDYKTPTPFVMSKFKAWLIKLVESKTKWRYMRPVKGEIAPSQSLYDKLRELDKIFPRTMPPMHEYSDKEWKELVDNLLRSNLKLKLISSENKYTRFKDKSGGGEVIVVCTPTRSPSNAMVDVEFVIVIVTDRNFRANGEAKYYFLSQAFSYTMICLRGQARALSVPAVTNQVRKFILDSRLPPGQREKCFPHCNIGTFQGGRVEQLVANVCDMDALEALCLAE